MTQDRLTDILNHPHSVTEKELETLETLTMEFPYYNLPHILLAKIYKENEDYKYDKQIKKASLRVIDREWLFKFIHQDSSLINEQLQVDNLDKVDKLEENKSEKLFIKLEDPINVKENESNEIENTEIDLTKSASNKSILNPVVETEKDETIELENETNKNESSIGTPIIFKNENAENDNELENQDSVIESNFEPIDIINTTPTETPEIKEINSSIIVELDKIVNPPIIETVKKQNLTFTEWLLHLSQKEEPEKKTTSFTEKNTETKFAAYDLKSDAKSLNSLSIIDSFLKNQPTISHPKTEFFRAEKAAMKSLELDDKIVTETLADVYIRQGHYEQAIWAYEKLKLKFPEKRSYFAALINELKKK